MMKLHFETKNDLFEKIAEVRELVNTADQNYQFALANIQTKEQSTEIKWANF